jgi:hypothetical protein
VTISTPHTHQLTLETFNPPTVDGLDWSHGDDLGGTLATLDFTTFANMFCKTPDHTPKKGISRGSEVSGVAVQGTLARLTKIHKNEPDAAFPHWGYTHIYIQQPK